MDWLDEIEAMANLVVKNHEDWSVADAVMLAGHDVPKLVAEVRRLRAELEAAKGDLAKAKPCDCCVHQYSGDCILEESFDPCSSYIEGGKWEWRGVTENGGANETD